MNTPTKEPKWAIPTDMENDKYMKTRVIPYLKEHGDEIGIKSDEDIIAVHKYAKRVKKLLKSPDKKRHIENNIIIDKEVER